MIISVRYKHQSFKPDDQVLDYFIYQMRVAKATEDVVKFFGIYEKWRRA